MSTSARAALAGNPSDGFGGAVCAVVVPDLAVTASVVDGDPDASIPLITAVLRRFEREVAHVGVGRTVEFESSIPRLVGLAGSSAIIIEALWCLSVDTGVPLEPMEVARLAHAIERVDLGIAGGWQDQLIQSHGFSALMDFAGEHSITPLAFTTQRTIPLYLAWSTNAAESSTVTHGELQSRSHPDDGVIAAFAEAAHGAAAACAAGDVHRLKEAMNESFDLRSQIMTLNPRQRQMVSEARELGACANYAGSGGAIIGVVPKDSSAFVSAMKHAGNEVMVWDAR